jgi:phospholipid/cholesterol/gamma-HCH transport system permease protein
LLSPLGRALSAFASHLGEAVLLSVDSFRRLWTGRFEAKEMLDQMAFLGFGTIPIVALTSFSSGAVISLYTSDILAGYGAGSLAGGAIGLAATRELAPVLAGIMAAARAGSAMAAQIATMAVTEQVDALRALGVHPTRYLVTPRLLAGTLMTPILALIGMYAAILGGMWVAAAVAGVPTGVFVRSLERFLEPKDVWGGLLKAMVFGFLLTLVACQQGLRTQGGAVGVGRATTRTVVISMVAVYLMNFALSWILFKP